MTLPAVPSILRHALSLFGISMVLAGCLIIPVNYTAPGSRGNVTTETGSSIQSGVTSREEVLLHLGEPDHVSDDGRRIGYAWTKVRALWFVGGLGGAASGEIERSYILEISFNPEGSVSGTRLLKEWGPELIPTAEKDTPGQ